MDNLCAVHGITNMFRKKNECQKPENTAAYPTDTGNLRNVQGKFLQVSTSVLQSMDQETIWVFK
jgi:hypothetical protein